MAQEWQTGQAGSGVAGAGKTEPNAMVVTNDPVAGEGGQSLPWPPPKRPVGRPPKNAPPWPYASRTPASTSYGGSRESSHTRQVIGPNGEVLVVERRPGPGRPPGSGLGHYSHRHRDAVAAAGPLGSSSSQHVSSRPPVPRNVPMMTSAAPLPLYMPLSHTQAYYVTYASRLKTGTTSMVLPSHDDAAGNDETGSRRTRAAASEATAALGARRGRTVVNYAALEGSSESEGDKDDRRSSGPESDDEGRVEETVTTRRKAVKLPEDPYKNRNPLGGPPPGNKVFRRRAPRTNKFISRLLDEKVMRQAAPEEEVLVPIRIEIDTEDVRVRDCFMWNARETFLSPELFAEILCEDLEISVSTHSPIIAQSIRNQLEDVGLSAEIEIGEDDVRVVVELDVQVQNYQFRDIIEWDLSSPLTPEVFAKSVVTDLGLPGEFLILIAHALHEQLIRHKQDQAERGMAMRSTGLNTPSAIERDGYPLTMPLSPGLTSLALPNATQPTTANGSRDETPRAPATRRQRAGDPVLQEALEASQAAWAYQQASLAAEARALQGAFRQWDDVEDYAPKLEKMSKEEMDKREIERERSIRRMRRELTKNQPFRGAPAVNRWKERGDSTPRRW